MKNLFLILALTFFTVSLAQTTEDTQDFISEQIKANSPLSNYKNGVFFGKDILKFDAERLANKSLTNEELDNIFIFIYDVFNNSGSNHMYTVAHVIDIRDISKVSTVRVAEKTGYYQISVYITNKFHAKEYENLKIKPASWKYIDKMEIRITDNSDVADKIKRAIIHLGKTKGINIKDGDLF